MDMRRKEAYSLRQSRYHALMQDVDRLAALKLRQNSRLRVIDVGCRHSTLLKYIIACAHIDNIDYYGMDVVALTEEEKSFYKGFYQVDLSLPPPPDLPNDAFDMVICEQVLEHLPVIENALAILQQLVATDGKLFLGVPIFPFGLHRLRAAGLPRIDALMFRFTNKIKKRGHIQSFSLRSIMRAVDQHAPSLHFQHARGFRIISGGILRPLENYRLWWRFNRWLGALMPGLCIEAQMIYLKNRRAVDTPARV